MAKSNPIPQTHLDADFCVCVRYISDHCVAEIHSTICLHYGIPTHSVVMMCLHLLILWSRYAFTHSLCGHDMPSPRQTHSFCGHDMPSPSHSVVMICLLPLTLWSRYAFTKANPLILWSRYAFTTANPLILWSRYAFTHSFCGHDMPSPTHSVVTICLHPPILWSR